MKWSISLPGVDGARDLSSVKALVTAAQALEQAGFDAGWVSDHPFPKRVGGNEHHAADPFASLAWVAAHTETLRLQTGIVVAPFRNPFFLANQAATVDRLSGGRLILGFGTGYLQPEFTALGIDYRTRGKTTRSAVAAWKAAWTGEPVTMSGDGWHADGNTMRPTPVSSPHPALWRGGNSDIALRHAALECDGWNPAEVPAEVGARTGMPAMDTFDKLASQVKLFRDTAREAGRNPQLDVILNRPEPQWRERDKSAMREEIAQLEEIGVTWLTVWLKEATNLDDYLRKIEDLAEVL